MTGWLLVIDMQPGFGHPDSPWFTPGYEACAARIDTLLPRFAGRALFTRFVPPAKPEGAWRAYYARWPFARAPENAGLWAVDARWRHLPSVASLRFSKWREAEALLPPEVPVTLCGVATDCCVLGTALEAVDAGRRVDLVQDACAAGSDALHAAALAVMADRAPMLRLVTTEALLAGS
ncbi:cysteine hydrolase family protein [Salipiger marinus]|uniref:cysteine hydrolase family protein n=1 Tax=Salipiger marinus TaxID=555512 RepID=UPI0040582DB9